MNQPTSQKNKDIQQTSGKKKISLLTHKKTQPSSQPHAGVHAEFFESNDAIPAQFLAHAQTFDRGGLLTLPPRIWVAKKSLLGGRGGRVFCLVYVSNFVGFKASSSREKVLLLLGLK